MKKVVRRGYSHATALLVLYACASNPHESASAPARSDPCSDQDLPVKRTWTHETRLSLHGRLLGQSGAVGGVLTQQDVASVERSIDAAMEQWVMMRYSLCRDYLVRKTLDPREYQRLTSCLDRSLAQYRTLIDALRLDQGDVSEIVQAILLSNREVAACR